MRYFYALVWGGLILAVARTTILVRRRDTAEFDAVDGSALLGLAVVAFLGFVLVINPRTLRVLSTVGRASPRYFLLYSAFGVLTALWSLSPAFSAFRAMEVLVVFLTAFVLMSRPMNFRQAEQTMLRVLLLVTLLSFLQRAINVGISIQGLHTNVYTVTAGMGLLYCFGEALRAKAARRRSLRRWSVIFLFFLVVGTSVGSNLAAFAGLLVMLMILGVGRVIVLPLFVILGLMIVFSGTTEDLLSGTLLAGRDLEQVSNLTGRNTLWTAYLMAYLDRPVLGYGFALGARIGDLFGVRATTNTHNGLIDAALGTGSIGLMILLLYLSALSRELLQVRRARLPGSVGLIGAFVMVLVNNNSKSLIGGGFDPTQVGIFVMLAFMHYAVYFPARTADLERRAKIVRNPGDVSIPR